MDISTFADDVVRAEFLFDAQFDPTDALRVLSDGIDAHLSLIGSDRLPEDLCGPVLATAGALMVGSLREGFDGPEGTWSGDPMELIMKSAMAAETDNHAAEHGDSLALAIRYGAEGDNPEPSLSDSYDGIVEWVANVLWSVADVDPALLLIGDGPEDDTAA